MLWWIAGLGAVLVAHKVLSQVVPPPFWYASGLKRRAIRLALAAFTREHPRSEPVWPGSWVYRADAKKCFVFVQYRSIIHPPNYAGYVIWRGRDEIDHLGGWQFHWGIVPRHAVEWYESQRAAAGGWPRGPVNATCGILEADRPGSAEAEPGAGATRGR